MNSIPNERISVFISSAMNKENDTEWLKIRKKIKEKLEECPYINTFIIEEHASEISSVDYFKFKVTQSDIVVLLIKEELRYGVQTEFSVVYQLNKPCLAYFFNSDNCDLQTIALKNNIMEEDLITFKTINSFKNIENVVYNDLIENIITQYKFNHFRNNLEKNKEKLEFSSKKIDASVQNFNEKDYMDFFLSCMNTILSNDGYSDLLENKEIGESLCHEFGIKLLKWVATGEDFPKSEFIINFENTIDYIHNSKLWIRYRWDAINYYENGNIAKALEYETKALQSAKSENIDEWLINNILIDCRNIEIELGNLENECSFKYQHELEQRESFVHFPLLDRMKCEVQDILEKESFDILNSDVYTVHYGSKIIIAMKNIELYIFISALYGSKTHLYNSRDLIANLYYHYGKLHDDDNMHYLALKYWILSDNIKKVEKFIENNWDKIYLNIIDKSDYLCSLLEGITCSFNMKLTIFKYFGVYFSDSKFQSIEDLILNCESDINANNCNRFIDTIIENCSRLTQEKIVSALINVLKNKKLRFGDKLSTLLLRIKVKDINENLLKELNNQLCINLEFITRYNGDIQMVTALYKQAPECFEQLNNNAKKYLIGINKAYYEINMNVTKDWINVINEAINIAQNQYNEIKQNKVSIAYGIHPLHELYDIIDKKFELRYSQLIKEKLIPLCKKILNSYAPISMKEESIQCLINISNSFGKNNIEYNWKNEFSFLKIYKINNEINNEFGYASYRAVNLRIILLKILCGFDAKQDILLNYLSFRKMDAYERKVLCECLNYYIRVRKEKNEIIDDVFIIILYALSDDSDKMVRRKVVYTLGDLYSIEKSMLIKQKINELMLDTSIWVRFAVFDLVRKNIIDDEEYRNMILQVYINDANYDLRSHAKDLMKKRVLKITN